MDQYLEILVRNCNFPRYASELVVLKKRIETDAQEMGKTSVDDRGLIGSYFMFKNAILRLMHRA